jgi:hypothetical protein
MRQAVLTAEDPVRRMARPVAGGVRAGRLPDLGSKLENRPRPAAVPSLAARVGPELVPHEEQRESHLRHLHARELDPADGVAFPARRPAVARRKPRVFPRRNRQRALRDRGPGQIARMPRHRRYRTPMCGLAGDPPLRRWFPRQAQALPLLLTLKSPASWRSTRVHKGERNRMKWLSPLPRVRRRTRAPPRRPLAAVARPDAPGSRGPSAWRRTPPAPRSGRRHRANSSPTWGSAVDHIGPSGPMLPGAWAWRPRHPGACTSALPPRTRRHATDNGDVMNDRDWLGLRVTLAMVVSGSRTVKGPARPRPFVRDCANGEEHARSSAPGRLPWCHPMTRADGGRVASRAGWLPYPGRCLTR